MSHWAGQLDISHLISSNSGIDKFNSALFTARGPKKKIWLCSNTNRGKGRGGKTSFRGRHGSSHGEHHQHEGQPHGGGCGNFKGRGSHGGCGGCGGSHQG